LDATTGEWLRTDRRFIHDGRPHALLPDGKIPPELRDPPSAKHEYEDIIGITPDGHVVVTVPGDERGHVLLGRDIDTLDIVAELDVKQFAAKPTADVLARALEDMGQEALDEYLKKPGAFFGFDYVAQVCDGWFIACQSFDGNEYIVDIRARPWRVHQVWPSWSPWWAGTYSPDGTMFAWAEGNKVLVRAVDPSREQPPCRRRLQDPPCSGSRRRGG
ncbi:MAG: hypothetical protein Q6370_020390, partial [Candidatus Sigynarchaeota archaeon]